MTGLGILAGAAVGVCLDLGSAFRVCNVNVSLTCSKILPGHRDERKPDMLIDTTRIQGGAAPCTRLLSSLVQLMAGAVSCRQGTVILVHD